MRLHERVRGLVRSPALLGEVLVRGRYRFVYDRMPILVRGMSAGKRWNLALAGGNLLRRRLAPWSMPLHMQFELTSFCNLRCPLCPTGNRLLRRPPGAMDPGLFERVMDEAGPFLLTASLWGWGEPLLHPELERFLRAARRHPVAVFLSTNGQRLSDPSVREALLESPPTHLIVALDGMIDATNSLFRVGGSLEPALEGVRLLAEAKRALGLTFPLLHLRFIVMRHNQHEVPKLPAFAERHGFDLLTVRTLSPLTDGGADRVHESLLPDDPALRAYGYLDGNRLRQGGFICLHPFWFPTVLAEGTVVSCADDHDAELPLGVVGPDGTFGDIWRSRRARGVRDAIRDAPGTIPFCRRCPGRDRADTDVSVAMPYLRPGTPDPVVVGPPVSLPGRGHDGEPLLQSGKRPDVPQARRGTAGGLA